MFNSHGFLLKSRTFRRSPIADDAPGAAESFPQESFLAELRKSEIRSRLDCCFSITSECVDFDVDHRSDSGNQAAIL
jgi:hypothetical protein